jgi:hypothetical protein
MIFKPLAFGYGIPPRLSSESIAESHAYLESNHPFPYINRPVVASTLKPIGSGLPAFIALGIDDPASTTDARSANSMPYGCLFWMR